MVYLVKSKNKHDLGRRNLLSCLNQTLERSESYKIRKNNSQKVESFLFKVHSSKLESVSVSIILFPKKNLSHST